jgi:hypothetical protein
MRSKRRWWQTHPDESQWRGADGDSTRLGMVGGGDLHTTVTSYNQKRARKRGKTSSATSQSQREARGPTYWGVDMMKSANRTRQRCSRVEAALVGSIGGNDSC